MSKEELIKQNLIASAKASIDFCEKELLNKELTENQKLTLSDLKEKQECQLNKINPQERGRDI